MQLQSRRNVVVNCGMSRSGKTTLGIRGLLNIPFHYRFIFDPDSGEGDPTRGEYSARLKLPPARDELELAENLCRGWVAFDPWQMFPGRVEDAFEWFCQWSFEMALKLPGQKIFVIDEAWKYCSPHAIPYHFTRIIKEGGKRRLACLINTQEPQKLNGRISAEMSELVCFRLQQPKALDFAAEAGLSRDEVANLQPLAFVARNLDSGGVIRGRLKL